jgi:hypothetical protein
MAVRSDWAEETARILKQEHGFTSHPFFGEYEGDGYGVSPYPERTVEVDPKGYSEHELAVLLTRFVVQNADLLRQPNHYVGGWRRSEHLMLLDVSIVTLSKRIAKRICKERDQLAFHEFGVAA